MSEPVSEADYVGHIYLAETRYGFHKIGRSFRLKGRMLQLGYELHAPVKLLAAVATTHVITRERQAHTLFAEWQVGREFFTLPPKQVRRFAKLKPEDLAAVESEYTPAPLIHVGKEWVDSAGCRVCALICGHVIRQGCHFSGTHGSRHRFCYQCYHAGGWWERHYWMNPQTVGKRAAMRVGSMYRRDSVAA